VTIGTFDGVHLGHQKILQRLAELKAATGLQTLVLTFDPHPRKVLFPGQKDLRLITLVNEKLHLLEQYGVDITVVYPFTRAFSELDAELYIKNILCAQLNTKFLVIGYDHRFGKGRSGDIQILKEASFSGNFAVEEISAIDIDSIAVSSTKIRKALEDGNLQAAQNYLGHEFILEAEVVHGKKLGRQLGYPTANLDVPEEKILPKNGVYFVKVEVLGNTHYGMMNIGTNPSTDTDRKIKAEVHIFDFDADLYNRRLKVQFIKRLRDELRFNTLDELVAAINKDKEDCMQLLTAVEL
jgi:riboflavin kinase/FMN adenylyltransferase